MRDEGLESCLIIPRTLEDVSDFLLSVLGQWMILGSVDVIHPLYVCVRVYVLEYDLL
jgi:hypothetical protein